MFPELNNLLDASPDKPEEGTLTLLCDVKTDGSFLVHHFLSFYLRAGCKVCFVALLQSFSHYNIVAQKLGVSLAAAKERGQLVFFEGLKSTAGALSGSEEPSHPLPFIRGGSRDLRPLSDFVRRALMPPDDATGSPSRPALLVDDLSVLLSLGLAPVAVLDFIHSCRVTVCRRLKRLLLLKLERPKVGQHGRVRGPPTPRSPGRSPPVPHPPGAPQGNVVVLAHDGGDGEDEENDLLVNALGHQSGLILRAEGLATGFCEDVHGQLTIRRRGPPWLKAKREPLQIYQYKIQDKSVSFFARGMSAAGP
ncbi:elongator complex protein 6 isoform X1 [Tachyglossus aculeatus]|uniref:elongator complex protein 6 isoform X1 n=1 Tax=Tachyglossus aculeatus TaxID=9261 RepID=UPI0018F56E4A|nr:elongator complex protein 6 isoform X1 [Tachyglossus aculeatus]